ncbi:hypothetical protein D3C76_1616270 [compost metagenome]
MLHKLIPYFLNVVHGCDGQLLQQVIEVVNLVFGFAKLLMDDSQTVLVFVITLEITLCVVRWCKQRIKLNGNVGLVFIVEVHKFHALVPFVNLMQGGKQQLTP